MRRMHALAIWAIRSACLQAAIALELILELGPACLAGDTRLLDMFRWLVPAEVRAGPAVVW